MVEKCVLFSAVDILKKSSIISEFSESVAQINFMVFHVYFSPWRIVDDCGGAFSMGAIGGSLFHGIVGMRNAPKVSRIRVPEMIF